MAASRFLSTHRLRWLPLLLALAGPALAQQPLMLPGMKPEAAAGPAQAAASTPQSYRTLAEASAAGVNPAKQAATASPPTVEMLVDLGAGLPSWLKWGLSFVVIGGFLSLPKVVERVRRGRTPD